MQMRMRFSSENIEDMGVGEESFFFQSLRNHLPDGEGDGEIGVDDLARLAALYTLYAEGDGEDTLHKKIVDALGASPDTDVISLSLE